MRKIKISVLVLSVFCFLILTGVSVAQMQADKKELQKVTITGTIDYKKNYSGYYIRQDPVGEIFIVNQNKKVLKQLMQSQRKVTIDGYFTIGADHLMIEKIDGKPYKGKALAK